jgi:protease YdgD
LLAKGLVEGRHDGSEQVVERRALLRRDHDRDSHAGVELHLLAFGQLLFIDRNQGRAIRNAGARVGQPVGGDFDEIAMDHRLGPADLRPIKRRPEGRPLNRAPSLGIYQSVPWYKAFSLHWVSAAIVACLAGWAAPQLMGASLVSAARAEDASSFTVDSADYPWSAIGRLNRSTGGFCTGVLIGRRIVLTAAHCLYYKRTGHWLPPEAIHFLAGYSRGEYGAHSLARDYAIAPGYNPAAPVGIGTEPADWALVLLEEPLGDAAGFLGWAANMGPAPTDLTHPNNRLLEAGYRQSRAHVLSVRPSCEVAGLAAHGVFLHSCDSTQGESGSPLIAFADGAFQVVGLQVARVTSRTSGVRGAAIVPDPASPSKFRFGHALGPEDWGSSEARIPAKRRNPIATVQQLLTRLRYDPGSADGVMRQKTTDAVKGFQRDHGHPPDGVVSVALLGQLIEALR